MMCIRVVLSCALGWYCDVHYGGIVMCIRVVL